MRPIEPKDLIERFCSLMDLDEKYIRIGAIISSRVDKFGICQENNPKSIAVGCIYFMSQNYDLGFSKKEIADNVGYTTKSSYVTNLISSLPEKIENPYSYTIKFLSTEKQIKRLSEYVVLIKVK